MSPNGTRPKTFIDLVQDMTGRVMMPKGRRINGESAGNSGLKVLWVTNLMAPYRTTLWESLGEQTNLKIVLIEGNNEWVFKHDRSPDWKTRQGQNFDAENLGVVSLRNRFGRFHASWDVVGIARAVRNCDVMMVGGWESPVYWQFMMLAQWMRKPVVIFHESTQSTARFRKGLVLKIKSLIFKAADAIVVPGAASHRLVAALGVPEQKIFEGFNAVDMDLFRRLTGESSAPHREEAQSAGHRFLYVGKLIDRKRVDVLIKEFARVRAPKDRLTIIGKGDLDRSLAQLTRQLGLDYAVDFLGHLPYEQLPETMLEHQTLVLPSRAPEEWGLVVNEALAAGLHVVVSDACGVTESVRGMRGAYVWDDNQSHLGEVMRTSAQEWGGPIVSPEILQFTNERLADTFLASFHCAMDRCVNL